MKEMKEVAAEMEMLSELSLKLMDATSNASDKQELITENKVTILPKPILPGNFNLNPNHDAEHSISCL
jgi:hypothetical protein